MSSDARDRKGIEEALSRALRRASAQSVLHSQAVADRVNMNPTDLECLDILGMSGPMPAGRLAEITGLTTGAITGIVDRLETRGYVRREKDPTDRRRVIIRPLFEQVTQDLIGVYEPLQEEMDRLYARYTDDELALVLDFFDRSLDIIVDRIAQLRGKPEVPAPRPRPDAAASDR